MDGYQFDALVRGLTGSRRQALTALAGGAIAAASTALGWQEAAAREPNSDAEVIGLNTVPQVAEAPVWRHTQLTVRVKDGNSDPEHVAAVRQAIATWRDVLDRHFAGVVTLTDITDDPHAAQTADIHIKITNKKNTSFSGWAICGDDACNTIYVKSDFPPGRFSKADPTPFMAGQVGLHEIGHVLGLGHAEPLYTTDDIMGYGFLGAWYGFEVRTPVISACDMKGLDELWAWALQGVEPYVTTETQVRC
jgi:hypothetical protein